MIDVARSIFIVVFILAVSACDPDSDQTVATSGNSVPAAPVVSAELVPTVSPNGRSRRRGGCFGKWHSWIIYLLRHS